MKNCLTPIQQQKKHIIPNQPKLEKSLEFVKEIDEENCTKTRAREYELKVNDDDNNSDTPLQSLE